MGYAHDPGDAQYFLFHEVQRSVPVRLLVDGIYSESIHPLLFRPNLAQSTQ